jgi:large subunit ribosomal protein L4
MADAPILGGSGTATLDDTAFGSSFNGPLVHESVRAEQAARRQGTQKAKTRGEVRGGGAKPWRQKGTGRARAGSSRSPIWTGGGVVFAPVPRNYTFKVNRKERRAALRSALSLHAGRGSIAVFDPSDGFGTPSTKAAAQLLAGWDAAQQPTLVVLSEDEAQVAYSFRNLDRLSVLPSDAVGVTDLVGAGSVLVSQAALEQLTRRVTK